VRLFFLCLALPALASFPAHAADSRAGSAAGTAISATVKSVPIPDAAQDELQPERLQQRHMEQQVGSPALGDRKNALLEQCWQMLYEQSHNIGPVHILSVNIIEEEQVYITGSVSEPDAASVPQTLPYECRVSADKSVVEAATVGAGQGK